MDAGGRDGGREALRPLRAAMFLDVCSSTALFSLRVKAKVQARPYTVWPLHDSLTHINSYHPPQVDWLYLDHIHLPALLGNAKLPPQGLCTC